MTTQTDTASKSPQNIVPFAASDQRDILRLVSIVLAVVGTVISAYLSWTKLTGAEVACIEGLSNCEAVNSSIYAYIGPVPVAYLGLAGYLVILGALLLEARLPLLVRRGRLLVFAMTLFGFLFSMYLTAIEAFVLHEWCQWCIASAITMTLLFGVSFVRLWRSIRAVPEDEEA